MDGRKQEYLNILNQKLDSLLNMLKATQILQITGEGDDDNLVNEAELYSSLYEQRAEVIKKIEKMDEKLVQYDDIKDNADLVKARSPIIDKIKAAAKEMAELDKKHLESSKKLTKFLRDELKKIRDGRDINNAYNFEAYEALSGSYFDKTN